MMNLFVGIVIGILICWYEPSIGIKVMEIIKEIMNVIASKI